MRPSVQTSRFRDPQRRAPKAVSTRVRNPRRGGCDCGVATFDASTHEHAARPTCVALSKSLRFVGHPRRSTSAVEGSTAGSPTDSDLVVRSMCTCRAESRGIPGRSDPLCLWIEHDQAFAARFRQAGVHPFSDLQALEAATHERPRRFRAEAFRAIEGYASRFFKHSADATSPTITQTESVIAATPAGRFEEISVCTPGVLLEISAPPALVGRYCELSCTH